MTGIQSLAACWIPAFAGMTVNALMIGHDFAKTEKQNEVSHPELGEGSLLCLALYVNFRRDAASRDPLA
jgi:hypothetical protein